MGGYDRIATCELVKQAVWTLELLRSCADCCECDDVGGHLDTTRRAAGAHCSWSPGGSELLHRVTVKKLCTRAATYHTGPLIMQLASAVSVRLYTAQPLTSLRPTHALPRASRPAASVLVTPRAVGYGGAPVCPRQPTACQTAQAAPSARFPWFACLDCFLLPRPLSPRRA